MNLEEEFDSSPFLRILIKTQGDPEGGETEKRAINQIWRHYQQMCLC